MASSHRTPKQWSLGGNETVKSFDSWRQNILYTLSLDKAYPIFRKGLSVDKKNKKKKLPHIGISWTMMWTFQKSNMLDLMLGQIANYCPIISRTARS
jgi:uncharacterized membrane protein YbaN (DUF454 family)